MFIKVTTVRGRRYAQLVESFRNEAGQPRQRTIATLGRLEEGGQVDRLIAALRRAQGQADGDGAASAAPSSASASLEFLESRSAGDVWALWPVCGVLARIGHSRMISDPVLHEAFPRCTAQKKWP